MMNSKPSASVDPFDAPMDTIPTLSEEAEAYFDSQFRMEEEASKAIQKTDTEIQIDQLHDLLSSAKLNSWEVGFCQSCLSWLEKNPALNHLSFKQKDVLGKTVSKYFCS